MKIYRRLLAYAKPYRKFILPFFIFTLIAVFFSIFQFALIIPLLNFLFDNETSSHAQKYAHAPAFSLSGDFFKTFFYYQVYRLKSINPKYALYLIAALIVVAVIFTNIFRYLAQRCLVNARTLLVKRLREALFTKINRLHLGYFTKEHKGDLLSRMNADVFEIEAVAANSIEVLFKEPYVMIGYLLRCLLFLLSLPCLRW